MQPIETVKKFLTIVRSGEAPERAAEFMADTVLAHQMNAEEEEVISRTHMNYCEHIRDFLRWYGKFDFRITELLAQDDKVYARWEQTGRHIDIIDGFAFAPTQLEINEIGSAVYRVRGGKIVEYWVQLDREGLRRQLEKNEKNNVGRLSGGGLPFSEAAIAGEMLYISGQIGSDPISGELVNQSYAAEAGQVMKNIGRVLERHGLQYSDLVNVTIYLTDMGNYRETNAVYSQYFTAAFPARVCIAVRELPMKASIEISAMARLK